MGARKIADIVYAAFMIVKGYEKGLYPAKPIKATDAKLILGEVNNGIIGSIGRGLRALADMGVLERIGGGGSRATTYRLAGCPGKCFTDSSLCGKYQTNACPIMKLKILLALLKPAIEAKEVISWQR